MVDKIDGFPEDSEVLVKDDSIIYLTPDKHVLGRYNFTPRVEQQWSENLAYMEGIQMHKRVDRNQTEIVAALRQLGATVFILSEVGRGCPDILVGYRGKNYLFEIKDGQKPPSMRRLTEAEALFFKTWQGQVTVINSVEELIHFINALEEAHANTECSRSSSSHEPDETQ